MEGPQIIIITFLWKLWLSRKVWIYWRPLDYLVTLVTTVSITKVCDFFLLQIKNQNYEWLYYFFRQIINFFFLQGIVLRPGPHSSAPAAFFTSSLPQDSPQRRLKIQLKAEQKLWNMLSKSELALMASVKQWKGNSGTLLSLTMGSQRYV